MPLAIFRCFSHTKSENANHHILLVKISVFRFWDRDESLIKFATSFTIFRIQRIGVRNTGTQYHQRVPASTTYRIHMISYIFVIFSVFVGFAFHPSVMPYFVRPSLRHPPLSCLPINAVRNSRRKLGQYSVAVYGEPRFEFARAYELAELLDQPVL